MWIKSFPWAPLAIAHLCLLNYLADSQIAGPGPQIYKLTADYIFDTLDLEWYDGGSAFPDGTGVVWEIQILRKEPMEQVALKTYEVTLAGKDNPISWKWTSDIPLNCTTHYVRIRSRLVRSEAWSEWSEIKSIPGKQSGVYPEDRVVRVGSDVTFCCVWEEGEKLITLNFGDCKTIVCKISELTNLSSTIHVKNVRVSIPSGFNAWCLTGKDSSTYFPDIRGTVLFVGYPPDTPKKFDCTMVPKGGIICRWEHERSTQLYGRRGTHYFLTERYSEKNITCFQDRGGSGPYECSFPVLDGQQEYDFTLEAYNHLGHAKASASIVMVQE